MQGDGKKNCYLRVHVLPDNYVYFESTEHPGHYLGIAKNGSACKPKEVRPESVEAQFFVRVEVCLYVYVYYVYVYVYVYEYVCV